MKKMEYRANRPSFLISMLCLVGLLFSLPARIARYGLLEGVVGSWRDSYLVTWRRRFRKVCSVSTFESPWGIRVNCVELTGYDGVIYHVIYRNQETGREGMLYFWEGAEQPFDGPQRRLMLRLHNIPVAPRPVSAMKWALVSVVGIPESLFVGLNDALEKAEGLLDGDDEEEHEDVG